MDLPDKTTTALYLRSLVSNKDRGLVRGEIYAAHRDPDDPQRWDIPHSSGAHCFDDRDIAKFFEPVTKADFYASLAKAMDAVESLEQEHAQITGELRGVSDLALTSGDAPAPAGTSALAKTGNTASQLRNKAHSIKRRISALSESVKQRQEIVQAKLRQKMAIVEAQMEEMGKLVEKLGTVVQMVNLYLGRDEEIVCLRDGEKASPDTPITVRQNVLYMDEEVALEHTHGIDITEVSKFDEWLLANPKNLKQVIPEQKGIVVLQVRRQAKKYDFGDDIGAAIQSAKLNQSNLTNSYWLIKNGNRLHRLWADITVGERLVPREDEVEHFFIDRFTKEPLRPGTSEYYKAMEASDKVRRHYMRLCLVLQGVLDRTTLFHPYKDGVRINLLDPVTWEGRITFLRDAEVVLTDGRPSFREWLATVNREMRHGQRVVGNFKTWFGKDEKNRIQPRNATGISSDQTYTLLNDPSGCFKVLFERDDEVRKGPWYDRSWGKADRRASYLVYADDDFILCIDNASVEDMRYYLEDRRHRKSYETMVPLLRLAIKVKEAEAKAEQPFRELLLNKLGEAYPEAPCSPEKLESLIGWWKFKVKEHRPLLADDAKAWRMIVSEYGRQVAVGPEKLAELKRIVRDFVTRYPDVLALWHTGSRQFVAIRSIDDWPVFVHRETYTVKKQTAVLLEREEWVVPRKSDYLRWEQLYVSPAWATRPENPNPNRFLPPTFDEQLLAWINEQRANQERRDRDAGLVGVYADFREGGMVIRVATLDWVSDRHGFASAQEKAARLRRLKNPGPLDRLEMPDFSERGVNWKIKAGAVSFAWEYLGGTRTYCFHDEGLKLGWENGTTRSSSSNIFFSNGREPSSRLIYANEPLIAEVRDTIAARKAQNKRAEHFWSWLRELPAAATEFFHKRWVASEKEKYLREEGDPEFFEDHLKTLREPAHQVGDVDDIVAACVKVLGSPEKIAGKTLADALRLARVNASKAVKITPDLKALIESDWKLPRYKAPTKRDASDD